MNNTSPLSNQVVAASNSSQVVDIQQNVDEIRELERGVASLSIRDNPNFDEVRDTANPDELRRIVKIERRPHSLIYLYCCRDINEIVVEAFTVMNLPKDLNGIVFSYVPNLFNDHLRELPTNIERVVKIRTIARQYLLFTKLDLSNTQITTSEVLELVQLLPNLTELNLDNCRNIMNIPPRGNLIRNRIDQKCIELFDALVSLEYLKKLSLRNTSLKLPERFNGPRPIYDRIGKLIAKDVHIEFQMQNDKVMETLGMLGLALLSNDIKGRRDAIRTRSYTSNDILLLFDRAIINFKESKDMQLLLSEFISKIKDINMLFKNEYFADIFNFERKELPCPFTLLELITYQKCGIEVYRTFLQRKEDIKINRVNDTGKTVLDIWYENHQEYLDELQNTPEKDQKAIVQEKIARSQEVGNFLISLDAKPRSAIQKEPTLADHFNRLSLK